jgi:PKD repeat protein
VNYGDGSGTQSLALNSFHYTLNHTYTYGGIYAVTVTITDNFGGSNSTTELVSVNGPPAPTPPASNPTPPASNPTPPANGPTSSGSTLSLYAVASAPGAPTEVKVYNAGTGALLYDLTPFGSGFVGGASTAIADVNGDGTPDIIIGAGAGALPQINVYNGKTGQLMESFWAFGGAFHGGVNVAAGDLTGSGFADIVVGAGPGGGPQITVYSGRGLSILANFYAFVPSFRGGVNVAVGDVFDSGTNSIIAGAGAGGGPQISIFTGSGQALTSFYAFAPTFGGGVSVATGDTTGAGYADIIAGAGPNGGPQVTVFDEHHQGNVLANFFAYSPLYTSGLSVSAVGNSPARILVQPDIRASASDNSAAIAQLDEFFVYDSSAPTGIRPTS